ncbi:MAG: tetratricopeptide repeat protein [Gemmatimonadales bacterium]|nr:tetratricopeptide repeat protein [Gemmatimonadales bacterium]
MGRLHNSRAGEADPGLLEGFEPSSLEGDLPVAGADGIAAFRPFGRDMPEQRLPTISDPDAPLPDRTVERARDLNRRGRRLDAIASLDQFLAAHPNAVEPRLVLAELLADAGEVDSALEQLGHLLELTRNAAPILVRRGALYAQSGRPQAAEADFREAIRKDASYWPAYRYLGAIRLRLGGVVEAVAVLREARSLAPQDPECALYLAEALLTSGSLAEAETLLHWAVEVLPGDPRGYTLLGRLHDRLGQQEIAMTMHRKAREVAGL